MRQHVKEGRWRRLAVVVITAAMTVTGIGAMTGPASAAAAPAPSSVAAGYAHTCSIRTPGTLWCWGGNYSGQLGDGTLTNRTAPTRVGDASSWSTIDAGTS